MKTNNIRLKFVKLAAVTLTALLLIFSMSGCAVPADKEMRAFWKAENGYNSDVQNVIERHGGLRVSSSVEYADGSTQSYDTSISEDGIVVSMEQGWHYIRYENEWYCYYFDDDGNPCFSKYAVFDEDYNLDSEYANPGFIFYAEKHAGLGLIILVDKDTTLDKMEDGSYIWTGSHDFDNGTEQGIGKSTIYLNEDCEITENNGTYYLEDGSVLLTYTDKFYPGIQNEDLITALANALEKANGKKRHLTYNAVKNGVIAETLEADVPYGFYCTAILPPQYYDEEDNVDYFSDIALTQEYNSSDSYMDTDIYFNADVEKY